MNRYVRILFTVLLPPSFYLSGILAGQALWSWAGCAFLFLLYMLLVWIAREWWTWTRYLLVVCLAWSLILLMRFFDGHGTYDSVLLTPLVLLLIKEQGNQRYFTGGLALITLALMVALIPTPSIAFFLLLFTFPLAITIRAINIHKDANRLSQRHLQELTRVHQELEQAHAMLQEMNIYSMRYAALAERTRLAQDMHDGLGHHLTSLTVQLQAMQIMLPDDPHQAALMIPTMLGITRQAMSELRQTVNVWQEDEGGLGLAALRGLVSQCIAHTQLAIAFEQDDDLSDWPVEISLALYRILQEALTNIMRHAEATSVTIQVQEREQQVVLTVTDNGRFTAHTGTSPGFGIAGMIARCQSLGGTCILSQGQPSGLRIQVSLPLSLVSNQARDNKQIASKRADVPSSFFSQNGENSMDKCLRLMLVEDHAIIRQGLAYILNAQPDMTVVGEAADADQALKTARETTPDLVLMDIRLPRRSGIEATRAILAELPTTKVVLLTTFDIQEYVFDGIRAGAVGYLLKDAETQVLLEGIRAASQGAVIYRSAASSQALTRAMQVGTGCAVSGSETSVLLEPLTEREKDILQQMALGHRNAEIARILSVSQGTVKSHVHRIIQKFGVEDRTQVVALALRQRIVQ